MEIWRSSDVWPRHGNPSSGRQEKTQLVEPYERTCHWCITMVRVCHHINSQNTARKSNYNNHCNTPKYFPTTSRRTQKIKTGDLTTMRGVCVKSDNQRKGPAGSMDHSEPKMRLPIISSKV